MAARGSVGGRSGSPDLSAALRFRWPARQRRRGLLAAETLDRRAAMSRVRELPPELAKLLSQFAEACIDFRLRPA